MAHYDALTDLANRALLGQRLKQALEQGGMFAIHHVDLDKFKAVNDTLGHQAGDILLQDVSRRLKQLARDSDTVARMGGDEFVILQTPISDSSEADLLARDVVRTLSAPFGLDGHQTIAGASIGIAIAPGDGSTPEQLLHNADLALYRAKSDGRGMHCFFEPAMGEEAQSRRGLEQDLRNGLAAGQFELHYQPVVKTDGGEISGFEALIRWRHPRRGLVAPNSFIPLAEEIGLIVPIGEWVIRQACGTASRWPDHLHVAVNISAVQFRQPGLTEVIVGALAASGLDPRSAGDRDHGKRVSAGQERNADDAAPAPGAGHQGRHGRFRHRLFVTDLSAMLPLRQDQDRPVFRQRRGKQCGIPQHRAGGGGTGARDGHDDDGGGGGERGATGPDRSGGLHGNAGLFVQPSVARRGNRAPFPVRENTCHARPVRSAA
ncbi:diguanylate cyclase (GGDEF)-like protein [Bradyrhizobium sp. GM5.1]